MPYFPVDDGLHSHPKAAAVSLAALGLWTVAGSWANDHLTDGDVPEHMVWLLSRGATELADELVAAGLWRRTKSGYRFHQWHADGDGTHRNIAKSEVVSLQSRKSSGGSLGNHRRWHVKRGVTDPNCPYCTPPETPSEQEKQPSDYRSEDRSEDQSELRIGPESDSESELHRPTPPHKYPPNPPQGGGKKRRRDVADDDPDWSTFWSAYPRKVGKGHARRAWTKAITKTTPEVIIAAARRHAAACHDTDPQYIPHPSTWLNGERWNDQTTRTSKPRPAGWWEN